MAQGSKFRLAEQGFHPTLIMIAQECLGCGLEFHLYVDTGIVHRVPGQEDLQVGPLLVGAPASTKSAMVILGSLRKFSS